MNATGLRYLLMLLRVVLFCFAGGVCTDIATRFGIPNELAPWIFISNGLGAVAAVDVFLWFARRRGWIKNI